MDLPISKPKQPSPFEAEYNRVEMDLLNLYQLLSKLNQEPLLQTMVPLASGVALQQGTVNNNLVLVCIGGGFFLQVDVPTGLVIFKRMLLKKQLEWAEFAEEEGNDEEFAKYQQRFCKPEETRDKSKVFIPLPENVYFEQT
jgi:hypothetical protein